MSIKIKLFAAIKAAAEVLAVSYTHLDVYKRQVYVVSEDAKVREIFEYNKIFFATLGYANEVLIQSDKAGIAEDAVSAVTARATMYMPFAELVDVAKEIDVYKRQIHV